MASIDILIGGESFKEIREHNCCYIDKTSILPDMLGSVPPKVSLITRPRRFGKTLTMTMFQEFFDINKQSRELFSGLAVSDNRDLCAAWMNQYPTLFITLKGVEGRSFEIAKGQMAELLQRVCIEHAWLLQSRRLDAVVKKKLALLKEGQASENDLANALSLFCHALDAYWGKPVILLIDEYDVPINCAEQNGYYSEMVGFMRGFLGTALKTNPALKFAVLTGCLRIAEESIFTGLNNFRCYGLADERFADKFGFTAGEAESLLAAAGFADKGGLLREWYDGYRFGSQTEIYCPWDVLLYIDDLQHNPEAEPKAYWNNTSGNAIVKTLIRQAGQAVRDKIEALIAGEAIEERLYEELTYDTLYKNERSLWSALYLTGYLTKARQQPDNGAAALVIPNKEVRMIFTDTVRLWFEETVAELDLSLFAESLWNGDAGFVRKTLNDILYDTISYYDNTESFYHGFVAGLLCGAGLAVKSNRENGLGRSDLAAEDGKNKRALIIELKRSAKFEELDRMAAEALEQIENRKYAAELQPHIKTVLKYSISFWKKECCVKMARSQLDVV